MPQISVWLRCSNSFQLQYALGFDALEPVMASLRACLRTMTLVGPMHLATLMQNMNQLVYEASAIIAMRLFSLLFMIQRIAD